MSDEEFEKLIEEGYEKLPEWVRAKIKNVALLVEDEPSEEVREREGLGPNDTLLGYYQGIPLTERGEGYGLGATMPDTITLYRTPIEIAAEEDNLPIAQVIAETIWHEFFHYFGASEEEVRRREQGRDGINFPHGHA